MSLHQHHLLDESTPSTEKFSNQGGTPSPENPLSIEILSTIHRISGSLRSLGSYVGEFSAYSLRQLSSIDDAQKESILKGLNLLLELLNAGEIIPIEKIDVKMEVRLVKKVLAHYKLTADESFFASIEEGDIIEIYSSDMRQLYRSMNFFNYTNYTLLDMSLFEWFVLWERPQRIIELMIADATEVTEKCLPFFKFRVPRHLLKETLNSNNVSNFVPSASLIDLKYIGALTTIEEPGKTSALICTSRCELVAEGHEALSIGLV